MKTYLATHPHPRGAKGCRHTDEMKRKAGIRASLRWAAMSTDQKGAQVMKGLKTRVANGKGVPPRMGASWKAGWREIGGVKKFYRSRWEANYARYLELLRDKRAIVGWEHEPETFWFEAIKRGARSYLPDFRVDLPGGAVEYHEVKGWMDTRSITKIKRMAKYHPKVKLVVIDAKAYRELSRKLGGAIKGWEDTNG